MDTGCSTEVSIPFAGGLLLSSSKLLSSGLPSDKTELEQQTLRLYCVLSELTGENSPFGRLGLCQRAVRSVLWSSYPELKQLHFVWAPPTYLLYPSSRLMMEIWEQGPMPHRPVCESFTTAQRLLTLLENVGT